jgi:hypothetical protein
MGAWWNEQKVVALLIAATILLVAWMVRFEWADKYGFYHRNRFTGVVCYRTIECWFSSERWAWKRAAFRRQPWSARRRRIGTVKIYSVAMRSHPFQYRFATAQQNAYFDAQRRRAGTSLWRRPNTRSYSMIVKSFNCWDMQLSEREIKAHLRSVAASNARTWTWFWTENAPWAAISQKLSGFGACTSATKTVGNDASPFPAALVCWGTAQAFLYGTWGTFSTKRAYVFFAGRAMMPLVLRSALIIAVFVAVASAAGSARCAGSDRFGQTSDVVNGSSLEKWRATKKALARDHALLSACGDSGVVGCETARQLRGMSQPEASRRAEADPLISPPPSLLQVNPR